MTNTQHQADLTTLTNFLRDATTEREGLEEAKEAVTRLHQHINDVWEQSQEESADPDMSVHESLFFARESHPDTPDDHAFGSDTDLRAARWQEQQPQPPEPDDWNSPRI